MASRLACLQPTTYTAYHIRFLFPFSRLNSPLYFASTSVDYTFFFSVAQIYFANTITFLILFVYEFLVYWDKCFEKTFWKPFFFPSSTAMHMRSYVSYYYTLRAFIFTFLFLNKQLAAILENKFSFICNEHFFLYRRSFFFFFFQRPLVRCLFNRYFEPRTRVKYVF